MQKDDIRMCTHLIYFCIKLLHSCCNRHSKKKSYLFFGFCFSDFCSDVTTTDLKSSTARTKFCCFLGAFFFCSMSANCSLSFAVATLPLSCACVQFLLHSASNTAAGSGYKCQFKRQYSFLDCSNWLAWHAAIKLGNSHSEGLVKPLVSSAHTLIHATWISSLPLVHLQLIPRHIRILGSEKGEALAKIGTNNPKQQSTWCSLPQRAVTLWWRRASHPYKQVQHRHIMGMLCHAA